MRLKKILQYFKRSTKGKFKKEILVHVDSIYNNCYNIEGRDFVKVSDLFPNVNTGKGAKYKVSIEEIN